MLKMCVMDKLTKWEVDLHLVEFSYNNGQQETLNTIPFEVLYGKKCRMPVNWDDLVNRVTLGPKILKEME